MSLMYNIIYNFTMPIKNKVQNNFYHYIDNKKFYNSIKKYKEKLKDNKYMPVPEYIQMYFWIIANKYSFHNKFINYSFRKDMISEALIICIKYINSFNCDKSKNPYSYFNQAIHNSFLQFILKEKKQSLIKEEFLIMEKERREGYGRKVGEKKKNYEEKVWD